MSPEQILRGLRDPIAEIFTVGVILYHLATGDLPFRGPSEATLTRIAALDFPRPRQLVPSIPVAAEQIIIKALAYRDERYDALGSLMEALEESVTNVPIWDSSPWTYSETALGVRAPEDRPRAVTLTHLTTTTAGIGRSRRTALECLHQLLCSLFDREEYRKFILFGLEGAQLVSEMRDGASHEDMVLYSIEQLARRGLIDRVLFKRMLELRPQRQAEILEVAGLLDLR